MPEQCECAALFQPGDDLTLEHHPDCKVYREAARQLGRDALETVRVGHEALLNNDPRFKPKMLLVMRGDKLSRSHGILRPDASLNPQPNVPRTIEELTAAMESMFEVGESTDYSTAVTGELYRQYGIGFTVGMSDPVHKYLSSKKGAIAAMWNTAVELSEQARPGAVLYWRRKPELIEEYEIERDAIAGRITMRLLISDKPSIAKCKDELAYKLNEEFEK